MAGGYVEGLVAYMRGDYLQVAIFLLNLAEILLEAVAKRRALGKPERKARAHCGAECEEFHLLAEQTMVALPGLFEQGKIFIKHLLLGECDAIHAHELLALLVAAPVGAGKRGHLHCLDGGGVGDMRATAEVSKRTLGICGDMSVLKLADELAFIYFATVAKHFQGVGLGDVGTLDLLLALGKLEHLFLNPGEILSRELMLSGVDIIIESILDGGADTEFHTGI